MTAIQNLKRLLAGHGRAIRLLSLVALLGATAKLVGLAKEMLVAARFGTGPVIDGYMFVFNLLSTPVTIWYGAIAAVCLPIMIRLRADSANEERNFDRNLAALATVGGLSTTALMLIVVGGLILSGRSGLSDEAEGIALEMLWPLLAMIPLLFVTHVGSIRLMATGRHANSLFEGLPALAILFTLLLAPAFGGQGLAFGTLLGVVLQFGATLLIMRDRRALWPKLAGLATTWRLLGAGFLIMLMNQALLAGGGVVDQLLAADLDPGSLATLGYALRVMGLILTLFALALPRVLLPVFAHVHHREPEQFARLVRRWSVIMFAVGAMIATALTFGSQPLVSLLFERGAFSAADAGRTSGVLAVLGWQLPFHFWFLVLSQAHSSRGQFRSQLLSSAAALLIKAASSLLLTWQFGLAGLAASACLTAAFQAVLLERLLKAKGWWS